MTKKILIPLLSLVIVAFCASFVMKKKDKEKLVLIETSLGNLKVKLYNETPQHRDNFLKLVDEQFYDSLLFHRVIKNFMVQTGDPDSKNAKPNAMLGMGDPGYTIEAEINNKFVHTKGALAAARTGDNMNPERRSSGSQFYIVHGDKVQEDHLKRIEDMLYSKVKTQLLRDYLGKKENNELRKEYVKCQRSRDQECMKRIADQIETALAPQIDSLNTLKYTDEQKATYLEKGGSPHLDGQYTVFGELVEGFDVLDKIAAVAVSSRGNRPLKDVFILSAKVVKK